MGPILIFDKSALQCLNVEEACWLENFFITNITPIFFVETLADLEKSIKDGRTPEQVVGNIAEKVPILGARPNVYHRHIIAGELLGQSVSMKHRQIIISGGVPVATADKKGIFYKSSPEEEAFRRWQRKEFLDLERQTAKIWRENLINSDLGKDYGLFELAVKPKSLFGIKQIVSDLLSNEEKKEIVLKFALDLLVVPILQQERIIKRWEDQGKQLFKDFAPYSAYVFSVDLFFNIAVAADLISKDRPTNKVDMSYLYYLPFCTVFVSGDKLHAKVAPFFIENDQSFVWAYDLKKDFKKLNDYYSKLPDEVTIQGVLRFAPKPPLDSSFLVTRLWDKHSGKNWRDETNSSAGNVNPKIQEKLMEEIRQFEKNAKVVDPSIHLNSEEANHIVIEKRVPVRRGKWRLVPPEVENNQRADL
jgi:hypothetical protein